MKIRYGQRAEIESFDLFDENNDGDEIIVACDNGAVVGYAQFTGCRLHFIESNMPGAGSALINWLKSENDYIEAVNVETTAAGFYDKMGFERNDQSSWGGCFNMDWYEDEE